MGSRSNSPQPATVDLVRADLAEVWSTDFPGSPSPTSPRIPSPGFGASDFVDLDLVEDPTLNPSQAKEVPRMGIEAKVVSPPARSAKTTARKRGFRNRASPGQHTPIVASSAHPSNPRPYRQPEAISKAAGPPGASKCRTKQPWSLPRAGDVATAPANGKRSKDDQDVFELSDATDSGRNSRPRKRPAKNSVKEPPLPVNFAPVHTTDAKSTPIGPGEKNSGPKKTAGLPMQGTGAKTHDGHGYTAGNVDRGGEPDAGRRHHRSKDTSTMIQAEPGPALGIRRRQPFSPLNELREKSGSVASTAPESPSAVEDEPLPATNQVSANPPNLRLETRQVEAATVHRPTSDLRVKLDRQYIRASDGSGAETTNAQNHGHHPRWPTPGTTEQRMRQPVASRGLFGQSISDAAATLPKRAMRRPNPNDAYSSRAEQHTKAVLRSPAHDAGPGFEDQSQSLSAAELWMQAVTDESPPAVLHRIVTLLHRSLKSKEEIVLAILTDYEQNALRLLANISARHKQEKDDTLTALRKASSIALSVFSAAAQEMKSLLGSLRRLDVVKTADSLKRPALVQKLDSVARLCQTRLSKYNLNRSRCDSEVDDSDGRSAPEPSDRSGDNLMNMYRRNLCEKLFQSDDQRHVAWRELDEEVDEFMMRCFRGESSEECLTEVRTSKKKESANRTADEALEQFLDGIIKALEDNGNEKGGQVDQDDNCHAINLGSDDTDIAGMEGQWLSLRRAK